MKKILLFALFLVLIPLFVRAETCDTNSVFISSITVEEQSDNVVEVEEPNINSKNINLNLSMLEVGDNIKYKVIIKNESKNDYKLDQNSLKASSDYIDYTVDLDDDSNIIKSNSSKTIFIKAEYKNEIPEDSFENGSYHDDKIMTMNLLSEDKIISIPEIIKNPKTSSHFILLFISIILIATILIILIVRKKKYSKLLLLIIGTSIIIPISIHALCEYNITINSTIMIDKKVVCGSFEGDSWEDIISNVKNNNSSCYQVGDTKQVDVESIGTRTLRIVNTSTPEECSTEEFSQTACGFVLQFDNTLGKHIFNNETTIAGGWEASEIRTYVNTDIYNSLPETLRDAIIETTVVTAGGCLSFSPSGNCFTYDNNGVNYITSDKLYILSTHEIWEDDRPDSSLAAWDRAYNNTRQLDYYHINNITTTNHSLLESNTQSSWWTRSGNYNREMYIVSDSGGLSTSRVNYSQNVRPAFRIG